MGGDTARGRRAGLCELKAGHRVARLSRITLREIAQRVGMRAPSLYSHFASKNAIYDAMFGQAGRSASR